MRLEGSVFRDEHADRFERGRGVEIRLERNRRDILNRRIVGGSAMRGMRCTDEGRDVPANQPIGPSSRNPLERLLRGDNPPANGTAAAGMRLMWSGSGFGDRRNQQAAGQDTDCRDRRAKFRQGEGHLSACQREDRLALFGGRA